MSAVENMQPAVDAGTGESSPGSRLAAARAAQSLTTADIARQLKLSVWQVDALEAGRYQQLPGPIFVRGFIRNYARLVKLDPNELVGALGESASPPAGKPEVPPTREIPFPVAGRRAPWALIGACAAVTIAALAVYEFYWNEPESPAAPAPVASASRAGRPAPSAVPAEASKPAAATTAPGVKSADSTRDDDSPSPAKEPAAAPGGDATPAKVAQAAPEVPRKRGEREVKLAFDQECWVEIRDRNERIIFSQLNRPGTEQSVSGLPPFSVVLGNAHGVRLTYDDKPVDLAPHTKIDVARLILP